MNRMTRMRLITAICIGGLIFMAAITGLTIKYNPGGEMMILGMFAGVWMYCLVSIMNLALKEIAESRKGIVDEDVELLALFNGWLDSERYNCDNSEHD